MRTLLEWLTPWLAVTWVKGGLILAGSMLVAFLTNQLVHRIILRLVGRTETDLDDQIVIAVRRPLTVTLVTIGLYWALGLFALPAPLPFVISALVKTLIVITWSFAGGRITMLLLHLMERHPRFPWVQARTLPIFEMVVKILIVGSAVYLVLLAWHVDVTAWLASAGVVGIAVGFAAKDTLANLFSGVFILADAPYKIGDFIVLANGERGRVTEIGIRSTRILTRDDIEIVVPNAVIANTTITNESGGNHVKERVRVTVYVAYGSDLDLAKEVLRQAALQCPEVCAEPAPRVRFREFGASGLKLQLLAWIDEPVKRGRVIDMLNSAVYKGLGAAGIEIPYSKHDLCIKGLPGLGKESAIRLDMDTVAPPHEPPAAAKPEEQRPAPPAPTAPAAAPPTRAGQTAADADPGIS